MKKIKLTKGKFVIVDKEDYEFLNQWKWCYNAGYAIRVIYFKRKGKRLKMQNVIMNPPEGKMVDHKNRNPLDCRKQNLRICTRQENNLNRSHNKINATSKYRGVSFCKRDNIFICGITYKGKKYHIGHFKNQIKAAKAYDEKAKELHGEFANLNFKK